MHWRRKWQPTPVFLPGDSQGWESLVGCRLWGRTESDTTEATQQQQNYSSEHLLLLPAQQSFSLLQEMMLQFSFGNYMSPTLNSCAFELYLPPSYSTVGRRSNSDHPRHSICLVTEIVSRMGNDLSKATCDCLQPPNLRGTRCFRLIKGKFFWGVGNYSYSGLIRNYIGEGFFICCVNNCC